jgi:hypothetical protein
MDSICDRCSREMDSSEANDMKGTEWGGCTICNDCCAEIEAKKKP